MSQVTSAQSVRTVGAARRLAVFGLLALVLGLGIVAFASAVWPNEASEERWFRAGSLEVFPPGTMTTLRVSDSPVPKLEMIHVARLDDGDVIVISGTDTHIRGCPVPWRPDFWFEGTKGWFRDPCRGSTYDAQGRRVFGPAPRDLDRLPFEVRDGSLFIDVSRVLEAPVGGWP